MSAVHRIEYLASWNFTHIVNIHQMRKIQAICAEAGNDMHQRKKNSAITTQNTHETCRENYDMNLLCTEAQLPVSEAEEVQYAIDNNLCKTTATTTDSTVLGSINLVQQQACKPHGYWLARQGACEAANDVAWRIAA